MSGRFNASERLPISSLLLLVFAPPAGASRAGPHLGQEPGRRKLRNRKKKWGGGTLELHSCILILYVSYIVVWHSSASERDSCEISAHASMRNECKTLNSGLCISERKRLRARFLSLPLSLSFCVCVCVCVYNSLSFSLFAKNIP